MFPGTKWQLISVVIILIIDFLVLVTQLLYQVRHWIIISDNVLIYDQHKAYYELGILVF